MDSQRQRETEREAGAISVMSEGHLLKVGHKALQEVMKTTVSEVSQKQFLTLPQQHRAGGSAEQILFASASLAEISGIGGCTRENIEMEALLRNSLKSESSWEYLIVCNGCMFDTQR